MIMTDYDFRVDCTRNDPVYRDREMDAYSNTLYDYHRELWTKPLPSSNGEEFTLVKRGKILYHNSNLGAFKLSSDSIGQTYTYWKEFARIFEEIRKDAKQKALQEKFFTLCCTIGGFIIFPKDEVNYSDDPNKPKCASINAFRGMDRQICDRFDLTLDYIRMYYKNRDRKERGRSNMERLLNGLSSFLDLFTDFQGYVDFFLLNDLVESDYSEIKFLCPVHPVLPNRTVDDYIKYRENLTSFINSRKNKIENNQKIDL